MAEATAEKATTKSLPLGQARIAGRIEQSRRVTSQGGSSFYTVMSLPAVDRFSSPATVEVKSLERLGELHAEVSIVVALGGYRRTVQPKDPNQARYLSADNSLTFVDFS